jgi:hypothetical protein
MAWKNPFHYTKEEKALSDAYIRRTKCLRHLLAPHQQKFYDLHKSHEESALYCSRKTGKTFTTIVIAIEKCIQKPNAIVRYAMSTLKTAKEVLLPILDELRQILPSELFPKVYVSDMSIRFKNGAQIKICGSNKEAAETARGPRADLVICDEVPAWDEYAEYMITGILIPQGTTIDDFKIIYAGTPPDHMNGYFIQSIYPKLQLKRLLVSIDIDSNPLLTQKMIDRIIEFYPKGRDDTNFRREHKLELIPNNTHRLTPEFNEELHVYTEEIEKGIYYGDALVPQTYQYYISADTGTVDNTAILVGYFDHHEQLLIIEKEWVKNNNNITEIAKEIIDLRDEFTQYFYHPDKGVKIIIDAFSLEHKELREIHGIQHQNPIKGLVEDNIAHLRSAFENNKIKISCECERLIWELKNCVWKESVTDTKQIERTAKQKHGDAIMALTYMLRAVNWRFRPDQAEHNFKVGDFSPKKHKIEDLRKRNSNSKPWGDIYMRKAING